LLDTMFQISKPIEKLAFNQNLAFLRDSIKKNLTYE